MSAAFIPEAASVMLAGAMLVAGIVTALNPASATKRVVGVLVALVGAMLGAAGAGAPVALVVAGVAIAFGYCAIGAALLVRLRESYATSETGEIDAADATADVDPAEAAG